VIGLYELLDIPTTYFIEPPGPSEELRIIKESGISTTKMSSLFPF
jgi:hypothetical protein